MLEVRLRRRRGPLLADQSLDGGLQETGLLVQSEELFLDGASLRGGKYSFKITFEHFQGVSKDTHV